MPHNSETSERTLFSFLIYKDTKEMLEQKARKTRKSQASIINSILEKALLDEKKK